VIRIEKNKVIQIVSGWVSINLGYTSPPKMTMLDNGDVILGESKLEQVPEGIEETQFRNIPLVPYGQEKGITAEEIKMLDGYKKCKE